MTKLDLKRKLKLLEIFGQYYGESVFAFLEAQNCIVPEGSLAHDGLYKTKEMLQEVHDLVMEFKDEVYEAVKAGAIKGSNWYFIGYEQQRNKK